MKTQSKLVLPKMCRGIKFLLPMCKVYLDVGHESDTKLRQNPNIIYDPKIIEVKLDQ